MYVIIWEYRVSAGKSSEFERHYSAGGSWSRLFSKAAGYLGTELLHESGNPGQYITIDRWASPKAYDLFQADWGAEYQVLDARCDGLTDEESFLGAFTTLTNGE